MLQLVKKQRYFLRAKECLSICREKSIYSQDLIFFLDQVKVVGKRGRTGKMSDFTPFQRYQITRYVGHFVFLIVATILLNANKYYLLREQNASAHDRN